MSKRKEIKLAAKEHLHNNFGTSLLSKVIGSIICTVVQVIPFGGTVVSGPLEVGIENVYVKSSDKQKVDFVEMFEGFRHNFGENFLSGLLRAVFTFLWSLLFVIPGIVKAYAYAMTPYIMVREKDITAMDAINKSRALMKGHKGELFILHLSFIGWMLLCVLTCGIASIYVAPYMHAAQTEFFNRIYMK